MEFHLLTLDALRNPIDLIFFKMIESHAAQALRKRLRCTSGFHNSSFVDRSLSIVLRASTNARHDPEH